VGRLFREQKETIKAEGGRLVTRMVAQDPDASPDDPEVQAAIGEYYAYLNHYFYTCDLDFLRQLADGWVADPRFAINYERIREGGAAFVREAVHIYCDRNGENCISDRPGSAAYSPAAPDPRRFPGLPRPVGGAHTRPS